jgi:hypothetical protein
MAKKAEPPMIASAAAVAAMMPVSLLEPVAARAGGASFDGRPVAALTGATLTLLAVWPGP